MKLEVLKFTENEDGSANIEVEMDERTKSFLIQEGFLALIEKGLEKHPLPEPLVTVEEAYDPSY